MVIRIATGLSADSHELSELREWIADEPDLRGLATLVERPPDMGALGPVIDALEVGAGPAGAVTALAGVVVAWLRYRGGELRLVLTKDDSATRVELSAKRVRELSPAQVQALLAELGRLAGASEMSIPDQSALRRSEGHGH